MDMEREIAAWNGTSADAIKGVYERYCCRENFVGGVIGVLESTDHQRGATWLLKAWLESGNTLVDDRAGAVYRSLHTLKHWEAKLHVLQAIPYMRIATEHTARVEAFLRETLTDSHAFVRAWSYNGFYELARGHSEYRRETEVMLDTAMKNESASVKARIRSIMKKGF